MQKYVILLRGINVGGKNKIKMADLKSLLSDSGFQNIKTYIQSGNIICEYKGENTNIIENMIELEIKGTFGYNIDVFAISSKDFIKIYDDNPFIDKYDISNLHICFLSENLSKNKLEELENLDIKNDKYSIIDKNIYLVFPDGVSGSEIAKKFLSKDLGVKQTCRNWKTITKLNKLINQ